PLAGTEGEKLAGSLSPFSHNIRQAPAKPFTRWSASGNSCLPVLSLSVKPYQRQIQLSEAEGPCSRCPRMHHHPDSSRTLQRRPIYSLYLPPRFNFQSTAFRGCEINEEQIRDTLRVRVVESVSLQNNFANPKLDRHSLDIVPVVQALTSSTSASSLYTCKEASSLAKNQR
ncbi:hypothetical protein BKA70DRAFT_1281303, partial [Coprinopsis sp. MPI-PUGE-AT-0042]